MVVTTTERDAGFELDIPEVEDAETSCDIVGTWVVQNSSIRFDPGEFMLTFVSGQIREDSPMIRRGNTDEVRERSPAGGIDLLGGSPKFELQSGGRVMNILGPGDRVEAVLSRVGGP